MRIVLDLQGAQTESRYRGIGRYTLSLAKAIIRNSGDHEVLLVLNGLFQESIPNIRSEFACILPSENIHVWHAAGPVNDSNMNNQWRREAAELLREAFIQSLSPDVIHIPSFFEGYIDNAVTSIGLFDKETPISVTMLDLIPLLNAGQYLEPNPLYKQHYLRKIDQLKSATKLFAISESARQEALQNLPFKSQDVVHQSIAIEPFFKNLNINKHEYHIRRLALGISKPFVLYTGGADSRKNLPALIKAYAALSSTLRAEHQLVFAGRIPEGNIEQLRQLAEQAGLAPEELYFTGYISDSELVELYNLCELFVFPSWHEGFGLPVLEAMACGAPTIAANTSSLPEVIGIAEALFCPFSEFDMSNKINLALTDINYKKTLKENSLKQVKNFSWDTVAKNSIKSFENMQSARAISVYKSPDNIYKDISEKLEASYPADLSTEDRMQIKRSLQKIMPKLKKNTLFVDISELFQRDAATGIQRVTRSLLLELLKNPIENYQTQPIYATPDKEGYYCANSYIHSHNLSDSVEYQQADKPIIYNSGDIFLGLDLQHQVVIAQQERLREMRNDGVYISFVVYDLLPILMPHTFPEGVEEVHKQWLTILADMDHLLCISNSVANELSDWLCSQEHISKALPKISWFHLGADIENSIPSTGLSEQAEQALAKLIQQPSFLCVGTLEPRKGQSQVLDAFEILWEQNFEVCLVLVGKRGWQVDELIKRIESHPEINEKLFWFDSISDEFLEKIYSRVSCLIAPSEGEGFGLPIIEGMKHNLPIIARDIPVFREVAGSAASYFLGKTGYALAQVLQQFILLKNEHEKYKYSWLTWNESAQKIKKILTHRRDEKIIKKRSFKKSFNLAKMAAGDNVTDANFALVKENKKLHKKTQKLKNKNDYLKKESQKNSNETKNISNLYKESKEDLFNLTNELEKTSTILNDQKNKLVAKKIHIEQLSRTISEKDFELEILNKKTNELEYELKNQEKIKSEKNTFISDLQNILSSHQQALKEASLKIAATECAINNYELALADKQKQIDQLKNSTSWRLTYPLRLFNKLLLWLIALPVRVARGIARHLLKSLILVIFKIRPLRSLLSKKLKSYPSLYGHLKRFSINRKILKTDTADSLTSAPETQLLTPHANKIYIALKNSKNNTKD